MGCGGGDEVADWRHYSRDRAATRFSPADRIDGGNVDSLEVAWRWTTPDGGIETRRRAAVLKGTPLYFDGRMFAVTSFNLVVALDPTTGTEIWRYDPEAYELGQPTHAGFAQRGIESWSDGDITRILLATSMHQLVSLHPATGQPDRSFGEQGVVDMRAHVAEDGRVAGTNLNSPAIVCAETVVVGSVIDDFHNRRRMTAGNVRGYDVRTGELRWVFHTVPREGEVGVETWEDESWRYSGNTNVWAPMSCDEGSGTVYLPVSTPTNDHYGGHRLGDNLFADSLVALDARSGERRWHFQTVHHGLWDYDLPCAPVVVDLEVDGRRIEAVVQATKQGFTWVLDRHTGEPVWPVEERPVPPSTVPGEHASDTQPYPTRPPPFERQAISEEELIDFTPELRAAALEAVSEWVTGPLYTPPPVEGEDGVTGLLQVPGTVGGANWGGPALDPKSGVLYVPSQTRVSPVAVAPPPAGRGADIRYRLSTPRFDRPNGLPILRPPYSRITAIDLGDGAFEWQVANGAGPRHHPRLRDLDLPPLGDWPPTGNTSGWSVLTPTLLFVAVAEKDVTTWSTPPIGRLRAFDRASGEMVWESEAEMTEVTGAPMTFVHGGRQYLVVPTRGEDRAGELVAWSLPE